MRNIHILLLTLLSLGAFFIFICLSIFTIRAVRHKVFNSHHICGFLRPLSDYNISAWKEGPSNSLHFELVHPTLGKEFVQFRARGENAIVWNGTRAEGGRFMQRKDAAFAKGARLDCNCMRRVARRKSAGDFIQLVHRNICGKDEAERKKGKRVGERKKGGQGKKAGEDK